MLWANLAVLRTGSFGGGRHSDAMSDGPLATMGMCWWGRDWRFDFDAEF